MSSRRAVPAIALTVVGLSAGLLSSGCASDGESDSSGTSSSAYATSSSAPVSTTRRPAPGPSRAKALAALGAGALGLNKSLEPLGLNQKVVVAIAPVGRVDEPIVIGDNKPAQVAWSTIKVPLAIAAERKHRGPMPQTVAAIVASDNEAAQALWASLGDGQQASAAVTAVLREAGDRRTVVPATPKRPPYTVFGQTTWSAENAARFTAGMACLPDSARVRQLMGKVDAEQRWGAATLGARAGVKGGWGPGTGGGYVVRQLALITHRDGSQTAAAIVTFGSGTSMASGTSALNHVGAWLAKQEKNLPRGYC
ncbi:hypothetical protein HUN08_04610 [Gordonia sp. X0973]|uniref:serine hydrolase n=1 Tax=Gordonia sp. X0973 TaxID=2742602 RepID=UPI000F523E30|nr:serine hydrolase [Gordonia sp. X0973]QKT06549.1 hypothetical protein HUN08_04610 [Gordonia sp. X0973]